MLLVFLPFPAHAFQKCECGEYQSIEEQREQAFAVFSGTVTELDRDPLVPERYKVEFEVHQSWKGADNERIVVFTPTDDAVSLMRVGITCGYGFIPGETYLVFTYRRENINGPSWTSSCWATKPLAQAEGFGEIERLGYPKKTFTSPPILTSQPGEEARGAEKKGVLPGTTPLPGAADLPESEVQPYVLPGTEGIPKVQLPYLER